VGIRHAAIAGVVLLAVAVAGCGSSATSSTTTENKPRVAFQSPALNTRGFIPASLRCSENKIWLPLRWGALPANAEELAIYVARFGKPAATSSGSARAVLIAQQLIIGLKPTLHGLTVGKLPRGALIGRFEVGSKRTSICPPKGSSKEGVLFRLYVLPHRQGIGRGSQKSELLNKLSSEAEAVGAFATGYS
jgi:phosphatidylethanolamine-binding protein (PEBP) family uncharacterized protein